METMGRISSADERLPNHMYLVAAISSSRSYNLTVRIFRGILSYWLAKRGSQFDKMVCARKFLTWRERGAVAFLARFWSRLGPLYRLVQIERPKLCPREFLTPFFRVRPRNFARIFWMAVSKTRRGGFFDLGFRCRDIRVLTPPGSSTPAGTPNNRPPRQKIKKKTLFEF